MSTKRKTGNLTSKKAKKMPKLLHERIGKNDIDIKKKLQELELALNQDVCDEHVFRLVQDMIKATDLPQQFSLRILKLTIKVECYGIARELLDNQSVDLIVQEGGEILWEAINAGNTDIATLLIKANANLSVCDCDNRTPLHAVLGHWNFKDRAQREKLARLMLEYGAEVNAVDAKGYSVLCEALQRKDSSCELVEELLNRGANVRINESDFADDLFWATSQKPTLLLKLIQHQIPDEMTRNQRGVMAIEHLIFRSKRSNPRTIDMIKKILDLGVPVNTVNPDIKKHGRIKSYPLLSLALREKQKDTVELLIKYGADIHQKDDFGHTPMYLAMRFKRYTFASRLLLEAGATIDEQDDDGRYPIHSACENESLRNIHLLLNLGADINVTDYQGFTPFDSLDKKKPTDAGCLVVKHFALIIAKGGTIGRRDMARLDSGFHTDLYDDCIEELERMKITCICDDVPYFSLLSESMSSWLKLMKNREIAKNFKQNGSKLIYLFPLYCNMLLHAFEIAEMRYQLFLTEPIRVQEGYEGILPDLVIERIAHYSRIEAVNQCQRDYYMSLHKSLKNSKADTEKIL